MSDRSDLFVQYAGLIAMMDHHRVPSLGAYQCIKYQGCPLVDPPNFNGGIGDYEFPVAVVEGSVVYAGTEVFDKHGGSHTLAKFVSDDYVQTSGGYCQKMRSLLLRNPIKTVYIGDIDVPAPDGIGFTLNLSDLRWNTIESRDLAAKAIRALFKQ